jgi:hypothetical protein
MSGAGRPRHESGGIELLALRASFAHARRVTPPGASEAVGHASSVPGAIGTLEACPTAGFVAAEGES